MNECKFSDLLGKTISKIDSGKEEITFHTDSGERYRMNHSQDCCESVNINDICGSLDDLIGSPILQAEESTSQKDPEGYVREHPPESVTWTFYRIATMKGQVVIRWCGESNGYYSESVDFFKL